MITYKYRLYPNRDQIDLMWSHSSKLNWVYNYFLDQRIQEYKTNHKSISRKKQQSELVDLKNKYPDLKEIHSQVLQQVPLRLYKSYKVFFKRCKLGQGPPKFRSCKKFFTLVYPQSGFSIQDNILHTKVYGDIKFYKSRPIEGNIQQIQITTYKNKWYLCVLTDHIRPSSDTDLNKMIGIDLGITNLVATNEGEIIKNKNHAKYFDKQINKLKSRRDKNCKKYSRKSKELTKTINRLYDMKNNKTRDFLHKVSKNLSSRFGTIFIEDLNLKTMSESDITGLNRELRNSQLSRFAGMVIYKTKRTLKLNPFNTSKTCSQCGHEYNMPLHIRVFRCLNCGLVIDRDVNSSKNIYCLGRAVLSSNKELEMIECTGFSTMTIREYWSNQPALQTKDDRRDPKESPVFRQE